MRTHLFIVLTLLFVIGAAYSTLARSDYCGFDDALELQRLTFQDPGTLSNDFSTVLFNSFKYRPGMYTLNRVTYQLGGHKAALFRIRNIVAHMLITVLLYAMGILLFHSVRVAAIGALLFGLNPLSNQAVAGGVWVIVPANLWMLLSFVLFLASLRAMRYASLIVLAAIAAGSLGVLIYDPVIVVYGLIYLYFFVWIFLKRGPLPGKVYIATLLVSSVVFLGAWFSLRARYLPPRAPHPTPIAVMARNLAIYTAAPIMFFDPVLSNQLLDTPLPSEAVRGDITPELIAIVVLPALLLFVLVTARLRALRENLTREDWINFLFLILAWGGSLLPYLTLSDHPSETYNYVGLLMLMLILSRILDAAFFQNGSAGSRRVYIGVVASIAILYAAGVVGKNHRVYNCGQTFNRILTSLPARKLSEGKWQVVFANVPGEQPTRPYGMYGYRGIDTLGMGSYGEPGIEAALQVAFHNPQITAESVDAGVFPTSCNRAAPEHLCYWVHWDGRIEEATAAGSAPMSR